MGGCRAPGTLIDERWGGARYSPRWSCSQLPKGPGHTQVHTHTHNDIHISLFLKAPRWKDRHWCPLIREQINKSWHIHIMEYLLSHERNKLLIHLTTRMTLRNADTTERIQTKNGTHVIWFRFLKHKRPGESAVLATLSCLRVAEVCVQVHACILSGSTLRSSYMSVKNCQNSLSWTLNIWNLLCGNYNSKRIVVKNQKH